MVTRITNAERNARFGQFGSVTLVTVDTPWGVRTVANATVARVLRQACEEAADTCSWRPQRIDSYNPRLIRGSSAPSMHGWALAWDVFATPPTMPPPGGVWKPTATFAADFAGCFQRRGFFWGRNFSRQDWPHLEWPGNPPGDGGPDPSDDILEVEVIGPGYNDQAAVRRWQRRLGQWLDKPFKPGGPYGDCDGDFGPKTTKAVKDAQRRLGIRRTGVLDANTMTEITYEILRQRASERR